MFVLLLALFPTSRVTVNDWCLEVKSDWAWAEKWKTGQLSSVGIVGELRARELLHLHPVPRISYGNQRPPVQRFVDQVVLYLDSKLKCSNKSNSNLHKSTLRRWWSPDMPGAVSKTKQPTSKLNKSGPENKTKAGDTCWMRKILLIASLMIATSLIILNQACVYNSFCFNNTSSSFSWGKQSSILSLINWVRKIFV